MSKAKARVFVPLTKVGEEKRLFYGRITQEMLDKSAEVMDYETSKPLFEAWSNEIHENSGGLSKGNVRVMHGLVAAGKLTELDFNDDDKAIDVCAKIVDDAEWEKCREGVYSGFSVGGNYAKRWTETDSEGNKMKKYTAKPNEVSLVDNPCIPSATFSMLKADGTEEQVEFKVENDDELWPDFAKAEESEVEDVQTETTVTAGITNDAIVAKAEEMAKAAGDDSTWMSHVEAARDELLKEAKGGEAQKETEEGGDAKGPDKKAEEGEQSGEESDDPPPDEDAAALAQRLKDEAAEKVTPPGVKQMWTASDGQAFEKKADAEAHELTLTKVEPTEAEALKARLDKALDPNDPVNDVSIFEDWDRLAKVAEVLSTPHDENGVPTLEKGMYVVSDFARTLWDMGRIARRIAAEDKVENEDNETLVKELKESITTLGTNFKTYATAQITQMIAGIDDDNCVAVYDHYYAAAKEDGENQLAKDVCSILEEYREPSRELRETLAKGFGLIIGEVLESDEELSPPMKKRFDDLTAENEEFKKVAVSAVEAVEELKKRVEKVEETPLPRAPRNVALRDGDGNGTFLGKAATTEEEKMAILHDMLKTHGADGMALLMIKAAQQNGQQLSLKQ